MTDRGGHIRQPQLSDVTSSHFRPSQAPYSAYRARSIIIVVGWLALGALN